MNRISIILVLLCASITAYTQEVKIVFDVTSSDPNVHAAAVRHVTAMANAYPDSEFEVVVYSGALDMVLKDKSSVADKVEAIIGAENVTFNVCAMTLKRYSLDESHLLGGVGTVPDGILEIVQRQKEGWGYIKEAR